MLILEIAKDLDVRAHFQETHVQNFREAIAAVEFLRDRESTSLGADADKHAVVEAAEAVIIPA